MKHNLTSACRECPYAGNVPGWIGGHSHPQEFVDLARNQTPFPCHSSVDYEAEDETWEERYAAGTLEQCAGQLAFMDRLRARPRDPEAAAHQDRVKGEEVLWPPELLVAVHLAGLVKGSKIRDAAKAQRAKEPS